MKLVLIGYGKMGKAIEAIALKRGHQIYAVINSNEKKNIEDLSLKNTEMVIEFTQPESAFNNLKKCIEQGLSVVSGTTGWIERKNEIEQLCKKKGSAFMYASNFSLGANIFFEINRKLSAIMQNQIQYDVGIEEIHHKGKKDIPSGTAIKLAEDILKMIKRKSSWKLASDNIQENDISISSLRENDVSGTHLVSYYSKIDNIEIKHTAHNRKGFALGAIIAAEWLNGKKGIYTMQDVLGLRF